MQKHVVINISEDLVNAGLQKMLANLIDWVTLITCPPAVLQARHRHLYFKHKNPQTKIQPWAAPHKWGLISSNSRSK
jgi:hypothetical protein